jgi:enamine deaminase RidA (YjgF/YER057c/UK114 family)
MHGRLIQSATAAEIYLTAAPTEPLAAGQQAEALFSMVRKALDAQKARLLHERIFATRAAMPEVEAARARILGPLDDGVSPVLLAVPEGPTGPVAGVQVHAVKSAEAPQPLRLDGKPCGRIVHMPGFDYIALSGLTAPREMSAGEQARAIFDMALSALGQCGGSMLTVARTWLWLGDILAWYDDFNRVRNKFFKECGLLTGDPGGGRMPASTGIGVFPASGSACALDVVAVVGPKGSIEYFR